MEAGLFDVVVPLIHGKNQHIAKKAVWALCDAVEFSSDCVRLYLVLLNAIEALEFAMQNDLIDLSEKQRREAESAISVLRECLRRHINQ